MAQRTFSDILGELHADARAAIESGRRHATALERFRALSSPIVEPMPAPRSAFGRSDYSAPERALAPCKVAAGTGGQAVGLSLADLRRELARQPDVKRLHELRRWFAMGRHPDRVPVPRRNAATAEMQAANDLIDRALRERG